ncbi:exosortase/archaeosortase family protein [Haloferula chungangensis]|uniref:Exosortase/archaeosortase family protein n=1 Tax=Haloferula chungangensis TaxID=1048331 RepID=A0ABW2LA97_9BACT
MESPPKQHATSPKESLSWPVVAIAGLIVAIFYFVVKGFGPGQKQSPLVWLESAWNAETRMEHGFMVPLVSVGLIAWQWKKLREVASRADWRGLPVAILGVFFFILAHRTGQPRIAIGGLPFILWGSAWYLWGWQVARLTLFPMFIFLMAIPLPQIQLATTKLQLLSTELAQVGCSWFGVDIEIRGVKLYSTNSNWEPLEIDEGCGGIRSLMALILISSVWAYLAKMALWKKALLCFSAIPLAILGNMLRLTSIFVIAEYGDPDFARNSWHDWSGLLIFYPISLILLLMTHSLLEGGMPKLRKLRTRKTVVVSQSPAN